MLTKQMTIIVLKDNNGSALSPPHFHAGILNPKHSHFPSTVYCETRELHCSKNKMLLHVTTLSLIVGLAIAEPGDWLPFSVSNSVEVNTDFSGMDIERFLVKLPCRTSVWFKLFLRRENGANSHIELYDKVRGNIYCNGAGARNWYDGQKTDFTIANGAMQCESDGQSIILVVEKTADRVTIKNQGRTLYNKDFTANDANCRQATSRVKTQVWRYGGSLGLSVLNKATLGYWQWLPFSVSNSVEVNTDFSGMDIERFLVKLPCRTAVWFKLFLRRENGANSHIELFDKVRGNIYCNGAGARNWYDGQKTDFTIANGAMQCESDGQNIILVVEKTADRVTIKNQGRTLYNKDFTANDANCRQATSRVKTQVWRYGGSLGLSVFDDSIFA
ncbi:hypothetical protein ACHWQZ_G001468 [Mnemiopsis leidyi]